MKPVNQDVVNDLSWMNDPEHLLSILGALGDQRLLLDAEGKILYTWSQEQKHELLPTSGSLAEGLDELFEPDLARMLLNSLQVCLQTGQRITTEAPISFGHHRWYEYSFSRLVDVKTPQALLLIRDISRRKQAEVDLQRFQQGLQALNEISFDAELDFSTQLDQALQLMLAYFHFDAAWVSQIEENTYTVLSSVSHLPELTVPRHTRFELEQVYCRTTWSQHQVVAESHLQLDAYMVKTPDTEIQMGAYIGLVYRVDQRPWGTIALLHQRPLEREVSFYDTQLLRILSHWVGFALEKLQQTQHLQAVNQHRQQLIRMISHDLRNPLSAIQGLSQLTLEMFQDELPVKPLENLTMIHYSSERAIRLLEALLKAEQFEGTRLSLMPLTLKDLIQNVVNEFIHQAQEKQIVLSFQPESAQKVMLHLQWFSQALENLLSNALKFTPAGGSIQLQLRPADAQHLHLTVKDSGIGIPEKLLPQIFDKFTAARRPGLNAEATMGLGLYLVRQIVLQHQGKIWCESQEGQGTTFHVLLPVAPPAR